MSDISDRLLNDPRRLGILEESLPLGAGDTGAVEVYSRRASQWRAAAVSQFSVPATEQPRAGKSVSTICV